MSSRQPTTIFIRKMTKKPRVVDRKPYLSTKIPERVGPRKFPKKNDEVHIPEKYVMDSNLSK